MKPIIFSTEMVRAILDGRKTVTRRVIPELRGTDAWFIGRYKSLEYPIGVKIADEHFDFRCRDENGAFRDIYVLMKKREGDFLWVRETWQDGFEHGTYFYKADSRPGQDNMPWRPSIFMPREAARIFLRVTNVRAERLQDMPLFDVWSEGTPQMPGNTESDGAVNHEDFKYLWDSINAKRGYGWDTNPWVWVYEFERFSKEAVGI
ncbi:MAG: hypothetical protein GX488_08580 [Clostridiales bacterium]|nr:hypothetical protein [Clostridiales bacterium]